MKSNYILGLVWAAAVAFLSTGCDDDLGNYDYAPVNKVDVAEGDELVRNQTYHYLAHVDYMKFSPELTSTLGITDDGAYDFEWRVIPSGTPTSSVNYDNVVVCREREINYNVALRPGRYNCYFNATDKASGVTWSVPFFIQVTSMTNEGWLVLCDVEGKTRLDVIFNRSEDEDMVGRDMLADYDYDPGKPERLFFNFERNHLYTIMVTDKDTYVLDQEDLHVGEDNRLAWEFGDMPSHLGIKSSATCNLGKKRSWGLIDENDEIYVKSFVDADNNVTDGSLFLYPITKIDGVTPFTPAPFIGIQPLYKYPGRYDTNPFMFYDQTHGQFLVLTNYSVYPQVMTFENSEFFENPTGRELVWMEPRRQVNNVSSVLRDRSTGEYFYYGIEMWSRTITDNGKSTLQCYQLQDGYCRINGPEIDRADGFAFHSMWNYLFYTVDNKIYQFNLADPSQAAVKVLEFPGEDVAKILFNPFYSNYSYKQWQRNREYDLVVCTNVQGKDDSECGMVRFYDIPDLMKPISLKKEVGGFGKIVDIVYKEPKKS